MRINYPELGEKRVCRIEMLCYSTWLGVNIVRARKCLPIITVNQCISTILIM